MRWNPHECYGYFLDIRVSFFQSVLNSWLINPKSLCLDLKCAVKLKLLMIQLLGHLGKHGMCLHLLHEIWQLLIRAEWWTCAVVCHITPWSGSIHLCACMPLFTQMSTGEYLQLFDLISCFKNFKCGRLSGETSCFLIYGWGEWADWLPLTGSLGNSKKWLFESVFVQKSIPQCLATWQILSRWAPYAGYLLKKILCFSPV